MPMDEEQRQREINLYLARLSSLNLQTRKDAIMQLKRLHGGARALTSVMQNDRIGEVRAGAANALGSLRDYIDESTYLLVVNALLASIDDSDDRVTVAAITSLGALRATGARDQLLECLSFTEQRPIVGAAVVSLARIGAVDIMGRLSEYIDSEDVGLRVAGIRAAGILNYSPAGERIIAILQSLVSAQKSSPDSKWGRGELDLATHCIEALGSVGAIEAEPVLIDVAENTVGLRSKAVEALVKIGSVRAAPLLEHLLQDPSSTLRQNILRLFKASDYRAGLPVVRNFLRDEHVPLRRSALTIIAEWQDLESLEQIRKMCYDDPNPMVRPHAVDVLVAIAGNQATTDLMAFTGDPNPQVRRAAVQNLGTFGSLPPEALQALGRVRDADPVEGLRLSASAVLQEMPGNTPSRAYASSPAGTAASTTGGFDPGFPGPSSQEVVTPGAAGRLRTNRLDSPLKVAREAVALMWDMVYDPARYEDTAWTFRAFLAAVERDMGPGTVQNWRQATFNAHAHSNTPPWSHRTDLYDVVEGDD